MRTLIIQFHTEFHNPPSSTVCLVVLHRLFNVVSQQFKSCWISCNYVGFYFAIVNSVSVGKLFKYFVCLKRRIYVNRGKRYRVEVKGRFRHRLRTCSECAYPVPMAPCLGWSSTKLRGDFMSTGSRYEVVQGVQVLYVLPSGLSTCPYMTIIQNNLNRHREGY